MLSIADINIFFLIHITGFSRQNLYFSHFRVIKFPRRIIFGGFWSIFPYFFCSMRSRSCVHRKSSSLKHEPSFISSTYPFIFNLTTLPSTSTKAESIITYKWQLKLACFEIKLLDVAKVHRVKTRLLTAVMKTEIYSQLKSNSQLKMHAV